MQTRKIEYQADGEAMVGYMARPAGDVSGPAVLIAHEGYGMTEHAHHRARMLADLGYVAYVFDYHGGGRNHPAEVAGARLNTWRTDPGGIRRRAQMGLEILLAEPDVDAGRIAAIGYCFGGAAVAELARTGADVKAVVGFHPSLRTGRPEDSVKIRGKVLMLVGSDDPYATVEDRLAFEDDMTAARVDWRLVLYGGVQHSFTSPEAGASGSPGIAYHGPTDRHSWREMLDLFGETIGTP
jgi:dienelactone hydrolase